MRFFVSASIQGRLFRILVLSLGGVAVAIVFLWQWRIAPALRSGVEQRQKQLLQRAADDILKFVDGRANRLVAVGEVGRFWEARRDAQKQALIRLMKLDPQIRNVSFADASGREVIRLSRDQINTGSDEVSVAQEPKFREPMKGNVFISEVGYERTAEPFMTVSVPVRFTAAEISGAMIADISLKTLWNAVANISAETVGIISVVDENGRLIAHPDYSKVLLAANAARSVKVKGQSSGVKSDSIAAIERSSGGRTTIQNRLEVPRLRWTVVVEEPEAAALGQLRAVQWAFFAILGITIVGAFAFSAYFSGRITGAVRELEAGAERVAQGDLQYRLEIHTGDEIESLADQFNRMAEALKESRQGLEEKISERTRDLSALYGALSPLSVAGNDELLQKVVERLKDATHADAALIRVFDKEKKAFVYPAHVGFPSGFLEATRDLQENSAVGTAFMTGEPIIAANIAEDPRLKGKRQLDAGLRSCAFLPLRVSGELRGIIHLASSKIGHFSEDKSDHLMTIARHMGVAVENKELFEETERRAQEQAVLNAIAIATSQSLNLDELLQVSLDKVLEVTGRDRGYIRLKDPLTGKLRLAAHRGISQEYIEVLLHRRSPGGKGDQVLESGEMLVINDPDGARLKEETRREGRRCLIWVPLKARGEVVGLLNLSTDRSIPFEPREVELLQAVGNVIGVALENARLYEEARTREAQTLETNRMLSALHAVAAVASQSLELDRVLNAAIEKITEMFGFDATRIHVYNEQTDEILLRASFESDPDRFTSARSFKRGQGIVGKVAESGQPLIFEDVATDPLYQQLSRTKVSKQFSLHFFAVFPIRSKLRNLGTLGCVGAAPRKLSPSEIQLLEAITDQIAVSMENSELYEHLRQKVQELQQKTVELERANKGKDEFLSVMSHELRTPLNVIMGYTGMLQDKLLGELNDEQHRALTVILHHSRDLLALITTILHATAIQAGAAQVKNTEVDLSQFLTGIKAMYDSALRKELAFHWDFSLDLPVIKSDEDKLRHILQNLINNAVKFTEKGNVTVSARVKECGRPARDNGSCDSVGEPGAFERRVEFSVADTGIGIAKEKLPVIFEMFRQVDSSDTRHYEGVGLGLYIVTKYTELLGGTVNVESEAGRGTVFTVAVPCSLSPPEDTRRRERLGYEEGDGFSSRPT